MNKPLFKNTRVTVMGLGNFGGGVAVVRFMVQRGAQVTVTDLKPEEQLRASITALKGVDVFAYHLGEHRKDDFLNTDLIVVNPGVPKDHPLLEIAKSEGVVITSEMNLFFQSCQAPIVGVTGSNGKSTTTAMLYSLFETVFQTMAHPFSEYVERAKADLETDSSCDDRDVRSVVWLGGNIGNSLLDQVDIISSEDLVVLELSSFQLETLAEIERSPSVAVLTNFSPNHLDRHGSMEDYRRAKQGIVRYQGVEDIAVFNAEDSDFPRWDSIGSAKRYYFGFEDHGKAGVFLHNGFVHWRPMIEPRDALGRVHSAKAAQNLGFRLDGLSVPGRHNQSNAMTALTTFLAFYLHHGTRWKRLSKVDVDECYQNLSNFRGLPHRLEHVHEIKGRKFYNDSIATTPESTLVAMESFDAPLILITGGYDKGLPLQSVVEGILKKVEYVVFIGETGSRMADMLNRMQTEMEKEDRSIQFFNAGQLKIAVQRAWEKSRPGDVVLLSPASASYDQFDNFQQRGDTFRELVQSLSV